MPRHRVAALVRTWLALVVLALVGLALVGLGGARPVHAGGFGLAFAVERHDTPAAMCPGETRFVEVELRNVGLVPWSPERQDRLAYHWRDESGEMVERDGLRTELPEVVWPGERVRVRARVQAPALVGAWSIEWAMVREHVRWHAEPDGARADVEVRGDGPTLAWSIVDAGTVPPLAGGETAQVRVRLRNDGCSGWASAVGDALGQRWLDADGRVVVGEGARTPMPDVETGAEVELLASVQAPNRAGAHVLVWEPVRDQVQWFGAPREGKAAVAVELGQPPLAWTLLEIDRVADAGAGDVLEVRARVRNDGTQTWSPGSGDAWSYRWLDAAGQPLAMEGPRTSWPHDVAPGEDADVVATLVVPDAAGSYLLAWQPVREDVRWLGAPRQQPADGWEMAVLVAPVRLDWAIERADVPRRLWAGRTTTVHVVVRNTGGDTWSPRTGDRLSFRMRDESGEIVPADAMRTELPHDVAPGERVVVDVRVRPPAAVGMYELELAMVREHAAWFPSPPAGARHAVHLAWAGGNASGLALVLALVLGLFVRTRARVNPWLATLWLPAATTIAVALVGEVFRDLSGIEPWGESGLAAISSAAWAGVLVLLVPVRARVVAAAAVLAFAITLALVDLGYLEFFGSIVPLSAVAAVHHLGDAHATVASLWRPRYAAMFVPALLLAAAIVMRPRAPVRDRRTQFVLACMFAIAGLPAASAVHALASGPIGGRVFSERDNVGRLGLWNAHAFEGLRALRHWVGAGRLDAAMEAEIAAFFAERAAERTTADAPLAPGANLVVIQVEALQEWVVDARIGEQQVMPFLHAAADATALRFTSIWDQTAQGRTSDAEYLVLQSSHPLEAGALAFLRADNRFDTIAHRLADAGYTTLSAHPYARGFWNRAVLHPRYGFASSWFREELGEGPSIGWGLADREFLGRVAAELATTEQPFFAFLVTLGLHHPYEDFPARFAELELDALADTSLGNYLQAMRHTDRALAQMFAALDRSGLLANTVVLVYGDHTAGLALDDDLLALAGVSGWDPSLATRMHRIPAVLWIPGAARHGRDDRPGGTIDLGPTVLDVLGVAPPASAIGRSLLREGPRLVALPDGTAIDDTQIHLVRGRGGASGDACVERTTGRGRELADCRALAAAARRELEVARAVLTHDLHQAVGPGGP